jgi:hypothetical protein
VVSPIAPNEEAPKIGAVDDNGVFSPGRPAVFGTGSLNTDLGAPKLSVEAPAGEDPTVHRLETALNAGGSKEFSEASGTELDSALDSLGSLGKGRGSPWAFTKGRELGGEPAFLTLRNAYTWSTAVEDITQR